MNFLEKDLETIIFETSNEKLDKRGLCLYGKKIRQLRIGNYGVCDIVCISREIKNVIEQYDWDKFHVFKYPTLLINIIELKKDEISANTLLQAIRYCTGIESYISKRTDINLEFSITLIGKTVAGGDFIYSPSIIENLNIYTYEYGYDGIKFKSHHGYKLSNEGFTKDPF